jgi:hypothetical protein
MIEIEKLVPISPQDCLDISDSRKVTLFDQTVALTRNGTAVKVLQERVNCDSGGQGPIRRSSGGSRKAYVQLTVRRIVVWRRVATESITKKIIVKGVHDIIPNYIAGGMDAIEGTYVWNYTTRNCPEEEWEELYKGRLGILEDEVITLDRSAGQRAWLRLGKGVTICGKRMRSTHLLHVYVEWDGHHRAQDTTKKYTVPPEERELESMRLEWSYQRGRDGYMLHRKIQDAVTEGCWMQGTLMELRQSQVAGIGKPRGVASHFGVGHLVVRSGGVVYVARCGMVVVEFRNHTTCTQEIPVTHRGKDVYVEPLSLVIQRSATPVKCRRKTPPRCKIGKKWFCGYPEIRPCNGPGSLPGHHRTNVREMRETTYPDIEKETGGSQQEGNEYDELSRETLEKMAVDVCRHWLGSYAGLESLPGIIGTAVLGVSAAEMVLSTAVRMSILYAWKGPGPWMAAAVWGTAFQVIIMPKPGEMIARAMEAKVGGANLPIDGGGTGSNTRN